MLKKQQVCCSMQEELRSALEKRLDRAQKAGTGEYESLVKSLRSIVEQKPLELNAAVAIVGGDPEDLRDERGELMKFDKLAPEALRKEAQRVLKSIPPECLKMQVQVDSSGEPKPSLPMSVDKFVQEFDIVENGGNYFFYYAGHGFELNGTFHFIPGCPETIYSCVALDDIVERLKRFYGCTFIFCINACRTSLQGEFVAALRNAFRHKSGTPVSLNNYIVMFPVAPGLPAEDLGVQETTFEKLVKEEFIPRLTSTGDISAALTDFALKHSEAAQDNPGLYFFPSAIAKPPTSGYTLLFFLRSHQDMQTTKTDGNIQWIQVEDHRKAHRRRVNRMTAPTVLSLSTEQKDVCVILDHTGGKSSEEYIARFIHQGMSANYMISTEGKLYMLVDEESMAWDYNLAYWGGTDFVADDGFLDTKGKINELKSYSISIALECKDSEMYEEKQYDTLLALLHEIRNRWNLEPWNVLGAEEVVQDPEQAQVGPGPQFQWCRLAERGFSLKVELSQTTRAQQFDPKKLEEWGYAFGPSESQVLLQKRKDAFCHRYNIDPGDAGAIMAAVDSLLKQRSTPKTMLPANMMCLIL